MVRPLLALDSASLYYRSFHALPESMTAPDGRPHNAVRGLLSTVARLVERHRPVAVVAAWDEDWRPQWRVDLVPTYKTHRLADDGSESEPDTLGDQAQALRRLLPALGVPVVGVPGFEADDVLGSIAAQDGRPVVVVSGDRDLVQLVDDRVSVLLAVNGGMDRWPLLDPDGVQHRFGVPADRYADLAVLRGDASDGLPGVPGIGERTAAALIASFGGLDGILAAASGPPQRPMTPRLSALLTEHAPTVRATEQVVRIRRDLGLPGYAPTPDAQEARALAGAWGVTRQADEVAAALAQPADE
jgi:5'-3' exonuclease